MAAVDTALREFEKFQNESLSPAIRISAARKSIARFEQAAREARNPDDKIAAIKNSGSVALRLAKIPFFQERESMKSVCYFFEYAICQFILALKEGREAKKKSDWSEKVEALLTSAAESTRQYLVESTDNWKLRAGKLQKIAKSISNKYYPDNEMDTNMIYANFLMLEACEALNGASKALSPPLGSWATPDRLEIMRSLITENEEKRNKVSTHKVTCVGCDKSPIFGIRYKCAVQPKYDLCAECYAISRNTDNPKPYIEIKSPQIDTTIEAIETLRLKFEAEAVAGGWHKALSALADAARPISEIAYIASSCSRANEKTSNCFAEIISKASEADSDRLTMERRARCLQLLSEATLARTRLLDGDDELNMDEAWRIADILMAAINTAQGNEDGDSSQVAGCLEEEATATALLGVFHYRVLKCNEDRARKLLMQSIQLAAAHTDLDGRTFFTADWYQEAKAALEEIRRKREAYDDAEFRKQRAPMLEKLKPDLEAMEAQMKRSESKRTQAFYLLQYLVTAHPPKKSSVATSLKNKVDQLDPDGDSGEYTKALRRILAREAALAYHSDKNKDYGMEWAVLSEEIIKYINRYNSFLKDFD
uniref:ZZ-type domain-containing protein n=1 Tax=Ditylum brightwellii TaxID=49249 RepID=A0A6V2DQU0_9STRA|mmetsp:Transcript_8075/g.10864  ORF Transcript_8075/g.10864 Transcript_8075/m.10864 type:complete len:596 (+) Transcript_8075:73-1860(+)